MQIIGVAVYLDPLRVTFVGQGQRSKSKATEGKILPFSAKSESEVGKTTAGWEVMV